MNFKRKFKCFAVSLLTLANTIAPLGGHLLPSAYASEAGNAPTHGKTIKDNGDGTYTIALSVTGETSSSSTTEVTKANVVLIMDTSSSMNYEDGVSEYYLVNGTPRSPSLDGAVESTQPRYYRKDGNNYSRVYYHRDDGNWYTSQNGGQRFDGPFYAKNRIWAEKHALTDDNAIIDNLLAQNVAGDPNKSDIIEIAVVEFNNAASQSLNFTNNSTTIKSTINGLNTGAGTNWESALQQAKAYADAIKQTQPNEKTYVIFLTDGEPTRYGNGGSTTESVDTSWERAKDDARALITSGYELYGLFTWGSPNRAHYLSSLIQYANTGTGENDAQLDSAYAKYYSNANSTEQLITALTQIVNDITTGVGYTNIEMTDGVTAMTVSTVKPTAGDVGGLKYYRSGGSYSTAANDGLGEEWTDAPHATINSKGEVDWNLGTRVLENGVTYTVTFIVYPSQESLDLVADLNNGVKSYDSLDQDEKDQIIKSGDSYTLKTNTDYPTLTYSTVTTTTINGETSTDVSEKKTVTIDNPDPVDLYTKTVELQKLWEDSLDPSQREKEVGDIYLQFYKRDYGKAEYEEYDEFHENYDAEKGGIKVAKVAGSSVWGSGDISISPGLMVGEGRAAYDENAAYGVVTMNGKKYAILNPGHDYKFGEEDINNHFELTNYIYHPMLVDGVLMNVAFTRFGNAFTGVESATEMSVVSATNTIKGGINIEKKVVDEEGNLVADSKDTFNVKVYMKGVGDYCKDEDVDYCDYAYDYRIYYGQNNPKYSNPEELSSTGEPRSGHKYGTGVINEAIYVGDTIRVVNADTGTLYYVEEINNPKGYDLDKIDYLIKEYTVEEGETPQDKADTVADNIDNKDYYAVVGNAASSAVVTNKYVSGNLEVSKAVVVKSGNKDTAEDAEFTFTFKLYADSTKATELTGSSYAIDGANKTIKSGGTFKLKNGESIKILKLPEGAYYEIIETDVPGYAKAATGDKGTIVKNETAKAAFTNTYSVSGSVKIEAKKDFDDWRTGDKFVFKLDGDGLSEPLTDTIDGADKAAGFEVPFDNIGTRNFTITEDLRASGARGGIEQKSGNVSVSVTATDNGKGGLEFDVVYRGGSGEMLNTIVNRYSANGGVKLGASKILTGRDWKNRELFTFTLLGEDGKEIDSQEVNKDKLDVVFSEIRYSNKDIGKTFVYVIHESTPMPGGMTNSGDITATVTVEDNHDGTLKTTVVYSGGKGEKFNTIVNTYSAEDEFTFEAIKTMVGRNWLDGETYNFVLKNENDEVVGTKPVSGNGKISFDPIKFTQADAGEHKYTITETGTLAGGLAKSDDIKVTLTVADDGNGNLSFEASYSNNDTITNTYEPESVKVAMPFTVKKTIDDKSNSKKDATFNFELRDSDDKLVQTKEITTSNLAGSVVFDEMEFDKAGVYNYTLTEVDDGQAGFKYDGATHDVVITITDNKHGQLEAEVAIDGKQVDEVEFKNIYKAEEASVEVDVEKILEGIDQSLAKEFEFILSNDDSDVQSVTIKGSGTARFEKLTFEKVGSYTYAVKEAKGSAKGYAYDESVYTVTIEVIDEGGKLVARSGLKRGDEDVEAIVFKNTYKPEEVTYGCPECEVATAAKKVLENRNMQDGEFHFEVYLDGELVATGYNTADGGIVFDKGITFNAAGTYNFVIKENVEFRVSDVVYDDNSYEFTVVVEDDGEGKLKISSDTSGDVTFVNKYNKPGKGGNTPNRPIVPVSVPVTNDDIQASMATLAISLLGLMGSLLAVKRYLKK